MEDKTEVRVSNLMHDRGGQHGGQVTNLMNDPHSSWKTTWRSGQVTSGMTHTVRGRQLGGQSKQPHAWHTQPVEDNISVREGNYS